MKDLTSDSLTITTRKKADGTIMQWFGQSDSKNPSAVLGPYLEGCIAQLRNTRLTIDFSNLRYMNSSTVSPIIQFVKKLDAANIPTVVRYDKDSRWQATSFKALDAFSRMLSNLTVKGV